MSIAPLTRRRFLSNLTFAAPASSRIARAMTSLSATQLAFVGIDALNGAEPSRIEVYRVNDHHWQLSSSTAAAAPHAIALHPTLPVLYVAHCTAEHQHRPRGSVSAFRIDIATASISPINHEPLTLAATLPNRMAIAPNGNHLVVASTTTGIFNLFQLHNDGSLISAPSPLKLPGSSSPQLSLEFHTSSTSILARTCDRTERLDISSDSSLVRGLPTNASEKNIAQFHRANANPLKRKLAAKNAASIIMLTV